MPQSGSASSTASSRRTQITRREALAALSATALASALTRRVFSATPSNTVTKRAMSREEIEQLLKPLFRTDNPAMFRFAVDVYQHCIFGRMQPAEPPLKHPWLIPGGVYVGQWIWDTTFLTDLLAIVPGQQDFIRGIYQNYWDSQQRWTAAKPDYAHGMIANFIAPDSGPKGFTGKDWLTFPAYSQAPLIAWGVERVYLRTRDKELVRTALPHLEAFHDWYWRERDLDNVSLVTVGSYDGVVQDARYETYDNQVDLDTLKLIPHPARANNQNGNWYGDIYIPANTAYLLLSERSLINLAEAVDERDLSARRLPRVKKGVAAMREHMWDEEQGCFLAVQRNGLRKLTPATIGGMVAPQGDIPTTAQASRMAQALATPHWSTPVPLPSVDRAAIEYRSDGFWRGDVWPSTVFQTLEGLSHYGHRELVADLAGRLLDNALKVGISEHYDSQSGAPLGVPNLGMSAVMLTMALEGLSPRHDIRLTHPVSSATSPSEAK